MRVFSSEQCMSYGEDLMDLKLAILSPLMLELTDTYKYCIPWSVYPNVGASKAVLWPFASY